LAHCRLAIIDLSAAASQPIANGDGSIQLTFNGEIYNFQELRNELIADGYQFKSRSDSEVIVHGYAKWGDEIVPRLRGDFAFALWDAKRRRLLLARDRLGVKPLFYALRGGELSFASETRALLPLLRDGQKVNLDAMFQYLRDSYITGPHTIWQGVSRLPPATMLSFDADLGTASIRKYWSYGDVDPAWTKMTAMQELQHLLKESVREELISDVPVGVFLSGGIDSSIVTALAAKASPNIDSFFIDIADWPGSEKKDAQKAAEHFGTRHHVSLIEQTSLSLSDPAQARRLFAAFDEPNGDQAIVPTWHLARQIRQHVTVALSGDGGDELFGGYKWYRQVTATRRRKLAWRVEKSRRSLGVGRDWPEGCANQAEYFAFLKSPSFTHAEFRSLFPHWTGRMQVPYDGMKSLSGDCDTDQQRHWQELDIRTYLVDNNLARVDRASMAHGLEVRVPLLDHRIVELAMSLPEQFVSAQGNGKPLMRAVAAKFMPETLHAKPKQGFSFPIQQLVRPEAMVKAIVDGSLIKTGLLNGAAFGRWLNEDDGGNHIYKLWLLFVLENWAQLWLLPNVEMQS
jgi:asparagine synthase (glutamine-hydrolysing)